MPMNIKTEMFYWLNYQSSLTENVIQAGYDVKIKVLKESNRVKKVIGNAF